MGHYSRIEQTLLARQVLMVLAVAPPKSSVGQTLRIRLYMFCEATGYTQAQALQTIKEIAA